MDIVCFGQQNWDFCWTAKQQLMTRLARRGHRVLYVDPTARPARSDLSARQRLFAPPRRRELEPGLWLFHYRRMPRPLRGNRWRKRRLVGREVRRLGMVDPLAFVLIPMYRWDRLGFEPAARVYYAVDEWTGFGGWTEEARRLARQREEVLLRGADLALGVSPRLFERFRAIQPNTVLLPNGADVPHFSPENLRRSDPHPAVRDIPRPRLGFVGQIDERLDQSLLLSIVRNRPSWHVVLVGRVKRTVDVSRLEASPNIHLLGYQPYERLPGVLREIDVCIAPYRLTELTQSCSPLKVYEYLATRRPVVASPVDGLGICRDVIRTAETVEEWVDAIDGAMRDPDRGREARLDTARACSWDARVDTLESLLEETHERARRRRVPHALRPGSYDRAALHLDGKTESERQLLHCRVNGESRYPKRAAVDATNALGLAWYGARLAGRLATGRPARVRRVLIVRTGGLGDLVALTPSLRALRRRFPEAKITLAVQEGNRMTELALGADLVDEVAAFRIPDGPPVDRVKSALSFYGRGFDVLITGASYFMMRLPLFCGAPIRLGLDDGHPRQSLLNRTIPLDATKHEADVMLRIVESLGCDADGDERIPTVPVDAETAADAWRPVRDELRIPDDVRLVAVHPGAKRQSRQWPPERFAELVDRLLAGHPDRHVVLTGVPDERPLVEAIREALPPERLSRVHDVLGRTNLVSLVGLLDDADLSVCNDTGVLHLARARGRPLLALLGPENHRRWGPYPVGTAPATALRHVVPCAPCTRKTCDAHYCLRSLTVDEAVDAAEDLLAGGSSGRATAEEGSLVERRTTADGRPLLRLRQTIHRHDWRSLIEAGFEIPTVTLVLPPDTEAPRTRRSRYPNVRFARASDPDAGDVEATLARVLRRGAGDCVRVLQGDAESALDRLNEDVASLVRSPLAAAAQGVRVLHRADLHLHELDPDRGWTFRAADVARRLEVAVSTSTSPVSTEPTNEGVLACTS